MKRAFTLGPDDNLTDDKLLQAVALATQLTGRTVYVFEDGWHGTLTITTVRRREKVGFELLLVVKPARKKTVK